MATGAGCAVGRLLPRCGVQRLEGDAHAPGPRWRRLERSARQLRRVPLLPALRPRALPPVRRGALQRSTRGAVPDVPPAPGASHLPGVLGGAHGPLSARHLTDQAVHLGDPAAAVPPCAQPRDGRVPQGTSRLVDALPRDALLLGAAAHRARHPATARRGRSSLAHRCAAQIAGLALVFSLAWGYRIFYFVARPTFPGSPPNILPDFLDWFALGMLLAGRALLACAWR